MSRLLFREARPEDDAQLTQLIAAPMPGQLSLSFQRRPSYLQSCQQCGPSRRVLVACEADKIVALTSFFSRSYWWDNGYREVWVLSDFRALPSRAGFGITGQGWKALRQLLGGRPAMLSVVEDNTRALALFSKPRPGWPNLHPVAHLRTNLSPLFPWPNFGKRRYQTRPLGFQEAFAWLDQVRQPLFPAPIERDFDPSMVRFWGVFDGPRLVGAAGLCDQSRYRQIVIDSYRGWYGRLAWLGESLRLPLLPKVGSEVGVRTLSLLHCPHPGAWRALKSTLEQQARQDGAKFLVWCRPGQAPPNLSFAYRSRLYQILWEGEKPLPMLANSGADPLSFEVSWL